MFYRHPILLTAGCLALFAIGQNAGAQLQLQVGRSAPFQTLEQARDAIRKMKADGKYPAEGVVVEIGEGVYPVRDTFELGPSDAGLPGAPVVYRARPGANVVLSGGTSIPFSKFEKVSDPATLSRLISEARNKVLVADLAALGIRDYGDIKQQGFSTPFLPAHMEVYGNDRLFELAKWPNEGSLKIGKVLDSGAIPMNELHGGKFQDPALLNPDYVPRGGTFEFDYDRADRWKLASDIWLKGVFSRGFAHDNLQVEKIDFEKRTLTTVQPHLYGISAWADTNPMTKSRHYVVYNLLEELDRPGECFVDKESGKLYLMPREEKPLDRVEITVFEKPFIAIENTAHIRIEGVTLENGRGMGIYMENAEQVVLDNLTVRGFGILGIMMGQGVEGGHEGPVHEFTGTPVSRYVGNIKAHHYENSTWDRRAGKNCTIQNCRIYNTGQGGVIIDGGSKVDLSAGNNRIVNCELYRNSNLRASYSPAVSIYGVGNAVRNCRIHHQPHNAVTLFGNDHAVEFNEIDHILQEGYEDMGAFYIGRNPSDMGNRVVGNYFHDICADEHRRITGVYLDDGTGGTLVASNIFYKVGSPRFGAAYVHFGHRNTIQQNVFIDCPAPVKFILSTPRWETRRKSALWEKRLFEDIDINAPPYSERYPLLDGFLDVASRTNTVSGNIFVNCEEGCGTSGGKVGLDQDGDLLLEGNRAVKLELPLTPFRLEMLRKAPLKGVTECASIPLDKIGLQSGN
ncbi:hypothetical protein PDESU_03715 [Pontiella desulfatans]|uniref:Right handed beta helix domain-containing protein n=2 Tax=Pontiella desulfatans TaxID=2750659 RepID=A0A6C2U6T3_PONDE|nr:hypothetical protein PDESU_03715 [Pontiella desulfatans]